MTMSQPDKHASGAMASLLKEELHSFTLPADRPDWDYVAGRILSAISAPEPQREGLADRLAELSAIKQAIRDFKFDHDERGGIVFGPVTVDRLTASIAAALALHAPSQPLPQEDGRVPDGIERRLSGLQAAVSLCLDDENLTDLATIKRAWFYSKTGFDEPVGSLPWRELYARLAAAPQPPLPSGAPDALAAKVDDICIGLLDEHHGRQVPGGADPASFGRGAQAGWDAACGEIRRLVAAIAQAEAEAGTSGTSEFSRDEVEYALQSARVPGHDPFAPSPEPSRQGVEADAARYRWLRDPKTDVAKVIDKPVGHHDDGMAMYEYRAGEELDAAIDAALAQPQGSGPSERGA